MQEIEYMVSDFVKKPYKVVERPVTLYNIKNYPLTKHEKDMSKLPFFCQ